ncbi:KAP P-loop [Vibrio kanaloae]|uniref:KAP P-loop n=1 Tax=Vibrio kanaloae TaxID=170673 RepID=A0A4U1ZGE5_9VIBR|nr:P-loop NTPase fold protein [Vibrio kanaloae]TKF31627.1 KAP P-loop [Vibrio kanaloae]
MDGVIHASRFAEWKQEYSWETCLTERENYGKFLISILTAEDSGHVINLNGAWGTGKTQFVRRLYVECAKQKYPVVYIDAWESDFLKDPMTVICSELLNQLGFVFKNSDIDKRKRPYRKAKEKLEHLLVNFEKFSRVIYSANKVYTSNFELDGFDLSGLDLTQSVLGLGKPSLQPKGVGETNESLLKNLVSQQNNLVTAMKNIRHQVSIISGIMANLYDLKIPIVIFVDELDRCRPDYAIKMLEIIKHFFDVKGCAFLISTDTASLHSSIKSIYGEGFDSPRYLKRFFDRQILLQKPNTLTYIKIKGLGLEKYSDRGITFYPFKSQTELDEELLAHLLDAERFELRDVEHVIQKLHASLEYITRVNPKKISVLNLAVLMFAIVEHHKNEASLNNRSSAAYTPYRGQAETREILSITVKELLTLQLKTVSYCISKAKYKGRTLYNSSGQTMLCSDAHEQKNFFLGKWKDIDTVKNLEELGKAFDDYPDNYFLWDDYKNLVGLTSHIE